MKNSAVKVILIGLLIIFISSIIVGLIEPLLPGVPKVVWEALTLTFGLSYVLTYNISYPNSKVDPKVQQIVNYLFCVVVTIIVYIGIGLLIELIVK